MGPPKATSSSLSKRWRPTSEQVMILKGLFKGGLTTPSSHQIHKITSQLKDYGKVESKNVFYWFQNHKAREKQKLTKKLPHNNNNNNNNNLLYYVFLPTQYPSGICPIFPAQAMKDFQWRNLERPEMMTTSLRWCDNSDKEEVAKDVGSSSVVDVTWLPVGSESSGHHQPNHHERPKTLQLFPTTASSSSCSSMCS